MKDPYEVLGVNRGATKEEIRDAYRELVKKYHPDKFMNNPDMKALAEEKIKEVNEAYKYLLEQFDNPTYNAASYSASNNDDRAILDQARQKISSGDYYGAEDILVKVSDKSNPEWYFLNGLIYFKQGWYDKAGNYLKYAHESRPDNKEYEDTYKQFLRSSKYNFNPMNPNQTRQGSGMDDAASQCLSCCAALACADLCCHCI